MAAIRTSAGAIAWTIAVMRAFVAVPIHLGSGDTPMLSQRDRLRTRAGAVMRVTMAMRGGGRRPEGDTHQHQYGQEPAHAAIPRN
ncbi:MAG: hypothetical protein C0474_00525 [Sphingobium sp.]|nr:hypothetical protein [Sphingobium sp.]